jgi:hypothetical protein
MSTPSPIEIEIQEPAPMNIATISAGFEKGDFLVREEQGNRVYFDFFEEVRKDRRQQNMSFYGDFRGVVDRQKYQAHSVTLSFF